MLGLHFSSLHSDTFLFLLCLVATRPVVNNAQATTILEAEILRAVDKIVDRCLRRLQRYAFLFSVSRPLKSIIFWDISPCSPLSFNRRFGETYRLNLQGKRNRFRKTIKQAGGKQVDPEDGGDMFLRNVG
jgi:hypothetical protein